MHRGDWVCKGRRREGRERGLSRVREVKKYKALVSVSVMRPTVFVSWQLLKLVFCRPTETGGERPYSS